MSNYLQILSGSQKLKLIQFANLFTVEKIASLIDVTNLKAETMEDKIRKMTKFAVDNKCASVCVNPVEIDVLPVLLKGSNIKECYVIDFPLGKSDIPMKNYMTEYLVKKSRYLRGEGKGKIEFDMVVNIGRFRKDPKYTLEEINSVCNAADGELVKIIIKSPELTRKEIVKITEIVADSNAGFIKNSTGMDIYGATPSHIKLMRNVIGETKGVKAAGGIKESLMVMSLIKAGANKKSLQDSLHFRIGTSVPDLILSSFKSLMISNSGK